MDAGSLQSHRLRCECPGDREGHGSQAPRSASFTAPPGRAGGKWDPLRVDKVPGLPCRAPPHITSTDARVQGNPSTQAALPEGAHVSFLPRSGRWRQGLGYVPVGETAQGEPVARNPVRTGAGSTTPSLGGRDLERRVQ